jgi:hypothetical protein
LTQSSNSSACMAAGVPGLGSPTHDGGCQWGRREWWERRCLGFGHGGERGRWIVNSSWDLSWVGVSSYKFQVPSDGLQLRPNEDDLVLVTGHPR